MDLKGKNRILLAANTAIKEIDKAKTAGLPSGKFAAAMTDIVSVFDKDVGTGRLSSAAADDIFRDNGTWVAEESFRLLAANLHEPGLDLALSIRSRGKKVEPLLRGVETLFSVCGIPMPPSVSAIAMSGRLGQGLYALALDGLVDGALVPGRTLTDAVKDSLDKKAKWPSVEMGKRGYSGARRAVEYGLDIDSVDVRLAKAALRVNGYWNFGIQARKAMRVAGMLDGTGKNSVLFWEMAEPERRLVADGTAFTGCLFLAPCGGDGEIGDIGLVDRWWPRFALCMLVAEDVHNGEDPATGAYVLHNVYGEWADMLEAVSRVFGKKGFLHPDTMAGMEDALDAVLSSGDGLSCRFDVYRQGTTRAKTMALSGFMKSPLGDGGCDDADLALPTDGVGLVIPDGTDLPEWHSGLAVRQHAMHVGRTALVRVLRGSGEIFGERFLVPVPETMDPVLVVIDDAKPAVVSGKKGAVGVSWRGSLSAPHPCLPRLDVGDLVWFKAPGVGNPGLDRHTKRELDNQMRGLTRELDVTRGQSLTAAVMGDGVVTGTVVTPPFYSEDGVPDEVLKWNRIERDWFHGFDCFVCFIEGEDKEIGTWRFQALFTPDKPGSKTGRWDMADGFAEMC